MNPASCPDVAVLRQLLLGQLSGIEATELEQHLLGCARCAALAEARRDDDVVVQAMRAQADRPIVSDDEDVKRMIDRLARAPVPASREEDIPTLVEDRASPTSAGTTGSRPPYVPGYEVLRELGHGGMGVVYLARQVRLNRLVALKMIRSGSNVEPELLHRFQIEAEIVARLQHPHIVQIHEVGQIEGMPYCCLEYCPGGSLADHLREGPLPPKLAVQILVQVADAIHAAHQAGIVHRDLKPANVLLVGQAFQPDENNPVRLESLTYVPKVTDFGLAKRLDSSEGQTQTGQLLGTPSYMAPEQASGRLAEIGPATDVYALGAILYELLTGRPPFKAATVLETLDLVRQAEPVPVRQLQPRCPRDLETISLKCLQKDPARRYGSAQELAEDLQRFLAGEPIRARPIGWLGRTARWVKRKPAVAALAAVCVLAGVALLGLGFWFSAEMGSARAELKAREDRARDAERLAQTHEFFELLRGVEKRSVRRLPGWTWANVDDLTRAAKLLPAGESLTDLRSEAATALGTIDVRPAGTIHHDFHAVNLAFQPGGSLLALGPLKTQTLLEGAVQLVDPRQPDRARALSFRPGLVLHPRLGPLQDGIFSLAFSPNGRFLVGGARSGFLHVWDLSRDQPAPVSWQGHQREITSLCFNPEGTALFSAADDRMVKRWSCQGWDRLAAAPQCEATWQTEQIIEGLSRHPTEGSLLCFSGFPARLDFLSGDTLKPLCQSRIFPHFRGWFTPDGRTLAAFLNDKEIGFLRLGEDRAVRTLPLLDNLGKQSVATEKLTFSPDGALLLAYSNHTKRVALWEMASGRQLADLYTGRGTTRAAFSTDGRLLAVLAGNQTLLYEIGGRREQTVVASQSVPIFTCALHPDGRSLVCQSLSSLSEWLRDLTVWSLSEEESARPIARSTCPQSSLNFDAQSSFHPQRQALAYTLGGNLFFHDRVRGTRLLSREDQTEACLSFGPDGRLWWAVRDGVRVWDVAAGKQVFGWDTGLEGQRSGLSSVYCVAAGRDWAVAGGRDGQVHLFHTANPSRVTGKPACQGPVRAVALNADESLLVAGSDQGELSVLGVPDGTVIATRPHQDRVEALSWSGDLLASGSRDRTVKLFCCSGGRLHELLTLRHPGPVRWLAFHPDGVRLFVLLDREGAVRVWHLDQMFTRFKAMNLGADLGRWRRCPCRRPLPLRRLSARSSKRRAAPMGSKPSCSGTWTGGTASRSAMTPWWTGTGDRALRTRCSRPIFSRSAGQAG